MYYSRRRFLGKLGIGTLGTLGLASKSVRGKSEKSYGPYGNVPAHWVEKWSDFFPAPRNQEFKRLRDITDENIFTAYCNFYEFSTDKSKVNELARKFEANPWEVKIKGEVENEITLDLDDLIRIGTLEERIYHFRCVEAWSANVPWTGFPLSELIRYAKPKSSAKYVRFVTVMRPSQMPGQRHGGYPWPYYEALTMEEAMNELALLTFGIYGHPLNKQNGAPVRLIIPWKYGFKSIKSIVRIEFAKTKPGTLWSDISREYGFYANTNPSFQHPRWSQATEIFLNTKERIPTEIYNGYGEYVANMYDEEDWKFFY
jgi:sulfoxide reductase catalytic subunit YedY